MPKRHRQPEPIDISRIAHRLNNVGGNAPHHSHVQSSTSAPVSPSRAELSAGAAARHTEAIYSPDELNIMKETMKRAEDFPATPETLARHRRQVKEEAKRRRILFDKDGQPVADKDCMAPSVDGAGVQGDNDRRAKQRHQERVEANQPFAEPEGNADSDSEALDIVSNEDSEEEARIDSSSEGYVGDDGNQPSSDDSELAGSDGESYEEEEAALRQLKKAVAAAAAHRTHGAGVDEAGGEANDKVGSVAEDGSGSGGDTSDPPSSSLDADEMEGETSDFAMEGEEDEETSEEDASSTDDDDNSDMGVVEDDEDDTEEEGELVTVDFGVFNMERSNIDGLLHLMDQLCPDRMNEVDRDALGLALYESPFTSVVRLQNNGEDATGEEEQEFYGLSSVLDVAHGQTLYPAALSSFCEVLKHHVWRQAASGIPPTDILTSVVDGGLPDSSRAKCLLLISEYIRNIPLELTVQILEDVLDRLDVAAEQEGKGKRISLSPAAPAVASEAAASHQQPIFAAHPPMLAVLAKVQRATDAPVTLPKSTHAPRSSLASGTDASEAGANPHPRDQKHRRGQSKKPEKAVSGASSIDKMVAPDPLLDLSHYIFWREEDSILYAFRDKRVAALVYRCRPQYDGQPEHEVPLSIFFVLQYGAARQAVDEMKRRQTVNASVERY